MQQLSYTDCKTLKEHGFPQQKGNVWMFLKEKQNKNTKEWYVRQEQWKQWYHRNPKALALTGCEWYSCPTLEELIEACGEGFNSVRVNRYNENRGKWIAYHDDLLNRDPARIDIQALGMAGFDGSSPSQAVASLYCALHPKK